MLLEERVRDGVEGLLGRVVLGLEELGLGLAGLALVVEFFEVFGFVFCF